MSLDFSTSHYLGIQHSSRELPKWDALTTGVPAAFFEPDAAWKLGKSVAGMQGLKDGVAAPSTLHLFWDWFGGLDTRNVIFADSDIYRVGAVGVERAKGKGVNTFKFKHLCPTDLYAKVRRFLKPGQKPVVISDGWCPFCGKPAALNDYLKIVEPYNGLVVVDDTQAFGLLGKNPAPEMPYGGGGGGTLPYLNAGSEHIIVISSLAKAFGAPLATLCGSLASVSKFRLHSEIRAHSSPPSVVAILAGSHALHRNYTTGDRRRQQIFRNVNHFRKLMTGNGFSPHGGIFPVQTINGFDSRATRHLFKALWKKGIRTVPVLTHGNRPGLCWLLNASHKKADITHACQTFFAISDELSYLKSNFYENPARRNFIA